MAEAKKSRETNFSRSYSDSGSVEIGHNDETVLGFAMQSQAAIPAEGDTPEKPAVVGIHATVQLKAAARYVTDILVGVGNAVIKAGGTIAEAQVKMAETLKALQDGTFRFRAASGDAGLSLEEEFTVIAQVLVSLGMATDEADALTKLTAVHARTKVNSKGFTVRPDYNALKNVPDVKAALAKAGADDSSKAIGNILNKTAA